MKQKTGGENMDSKSDFKDWREFLPQTTGNLLKMRQKAYSDGSIDSKYKILMALGMAIVAKCEPCIKSYVDKAKEAGISDDEFKELLEVAITFSGCVGEQWAIIAWNFWNKNNISKADNCC